MGANLRGPRGFRRASPGGVAAEIAGQPLLRCAEAEGTELTGGPGWQRRGEGQRAAESGRWLVGSGAQWERATRSRASG